MVREGLTVDFHDAFLRHDALDVSSQTQIDPMFLVPRQVADHDFCLRNLLAQHRRKRDAIVERVRLVAKKRDFAGRVVLAQMLGRRRSGKAVADDHVSARVGGRHACRPSATIMSCPTSRARSSISKRALCCGSEPTLVPRAPTRKYAPGLSCCMNAMSSDHMTMSCGSTTLPEPSSSRPTFRTMALTAASLIVGG